MSCNHLYDCLRCGSEVESLEQRIEELEQWIAGFEEHYGKKIRWWDEEKKDSVVLDGNGNV